MATQKELADSLVNDVVPQLKKVNSEIAGVQTKVTAALAEIKRLEDLIAAGGDASPEIVAAVAAVKAEVQAADDGIPDAVTVPVV